MSKGTIEDPVLVANRKKRVWKSEQESRTRKALAAECDVNRIMARALKGGEIPRRPGGMYVDVSGAGTFAEAQEKLRKGRELFDQLPRSVRRHFDDDMRTFLAWFVSEADRKELEALGGKAAGGNAAAADLGGKGTGEGPDPNVGNATLDAPPKTGGEVK